MHLPMCFATGVKQLFELTHDMNEYHINNEIMLEFFATLSIACTRYHYLNQKNKFSS